MNGKIDFKATAFILVKPPSRIISQHKLKNVAEYQDLLDKAIASNYCLYSAPIVKRNGTYIAIQPWQLHMDTIPRLDVSEEEPITVSAEPDQLCCPFCDKPVASTPGRTLHVKSNHADRFEEYQQWLKSLGKKSKK